MIHACARRQDLESCFYPSVAVAIDCSRTGQTRKSSPEISSEKVPAVSISPYVFDRGYRLDLKIPRMSTEGLAQAGSRIVVIASLSQKKNFSGSCTLRNRVQKEQGSIWRRVDILKL